MEEEDCDPASDPKEKIAPVSTLELISWQRPAVCLQRPFGICSGRRMDKEYPEFYVTDTKQMCIFRIEDVVALEKAKLRGRLSQMTLAPVDKACFIPVSVQYIDLRLLVANSNPAKPEVLVCHAFTGAVLQVITSPLLRCPSGIAMTKTGTKLFITDSVSHVVLEVQQWGKPNYTVDVWVGQDKNSGTVDGTGPSAKLSCPHGITLFGNTVVLCDSGNGAIRVVTSGDPLRKICSVFYEYAKLFHLDHKRVNDGNPPRSFEEGMKVVDGVVDFLFKWEEENRKRTGRRSTQGPDQIIPYATRRSFVLMHKSLGRLVNLFEEIHVSSITQKICFASLVTLGIESFFSLMREDDPMPTCLRELDKHMYDGEFVYFTGPSSYYPEKIIHASPPPYPSKVSKLQEGISKLSLTDKLTLHDFAGVYGRSVRQNSVREKTKEETCHLPYEVSFRLQAEKSGTVVHTQSIATDGGGGIVEEGDDRDDVLGVRQSLIMPYNVLFSKGDVVAVRHARKREQWGFFLALLNKDLVVKQRSSVDIVFLDGAMDITWFENSSSDDIFFFREGNRDTHNSPYTVIDKVDVGLGEDDQGRFYIICQADVDRLERQLKGGPDSDVASESSDDEENGEPESFEPRVSVTTRSGRLTSRLRLC